jgi:hypothetical protein
MRTCAYGRLDGHNNSRLENHPAMPVVASVQRNALSVWTIQLTVLGRHKARGR